MRAMHVLYYDNMNYSVDFNLVRLNSSLTSWYQCLCSIASKRSGTCLLAPAPFLFAHVALDIELDRMSGSLIDIPLFSYALLAIRAATEQRAVIVDTSSESDGGAHVT
jgi:hypothetical protein